MTDPSGPLIGVDGLAADLDRFTVLDVRYRLGGPPGRPEYVAGHIPGAAYVDLDAALAGPPGEGGRHPLPDTADFEDAMRAAGVHDAHPVVVYDDWSGWAAARCWWLLRHHGHADVRLLDGGWRAWSSAGGRIETGDGSLPARGDFTARPGATPVLGVDEVAAVPVLVDARTPERFRGETEPVDPVAGHIPGAVNVPSARTLATDGRLRSAAELRGLYAEVGAAVGARVGVYCGSGITAAHDVLALEVAGVTAALFPGSWSEWITDPSRPVATGD